MTCPNCHAKMDYYDHGQCSKCAEYCGCSWGPTLRVDFCDFHWNEPKIDRVMKRLDR